MVYILYGIFFLSCIVLVAAVLLQPGKTDAGALFTSNVSSTAFSPRGTATVLSKVTIAAAAAFMFSALFLAMPALNGNVSVLSSNPDDPAAAVAADANSNTAPAEETNSNTESTIPGETNTNSEPAANSSAPTNTETPTNTEPPANK